MAWPLGGGSRVASEAEAGGLGVCVHDACALGHGSFHAASLTAQDSGGKLFLVKLRGSEEVPWLGGGRVVEVWRVLSLCVSTPGPVFGAQARYQD